MRAPTQAGRGTETGCTNRRAKKAPACSPLDSPTPGLGEQLQLEYSKACGTYRKSCGGQQRWQGPPTEGSSITTTLPSPTPFLRPPSGHARQLQRQGPAAPISLLANLPSALGSKQTMGAPPPSPPGFLPSHLTLLAAPGLGRPRHPLGAMARFTCLQSSGGGGGAPGLQSSNLNPTILPEWTKGGSGESAWAPFF